MSKEEDGSLREQERYVQQIADLTPVVINVFDLATERDIYISSDVFSLLGYTPAEMVQMEDAISTFWHPEDIPIAREQLARSKEAAEGETSEFEYRVRRRDGEWRWLRSRSVPFARDEHGAVRQIVTATFDITESKRVEQRLAYHAHLLENVHDAIIATDERFVVTAWNRAAEQIYGWSLDEVIGRDIREVTRSEMDAGRRDEVLRMVAETGSYNVETIHHRKDGSPIHVEGSVMALRDAPGRVTGYVTVHRDITERKQAEDQLRRAHDELEQRVVERTRQLSAINEELLSEIDKRERAEEQIAYHAYLLENLHDAVIATDERLAVMAWNKGAEKMYGWRADEALGRYIWEVVPVDLSEEQRATALRELEEMGHHRTEAVTYRKDGTPVYVEGVTIALRGEQGEGRITGYVNIRRDVTERKRAEEERRQLLRQLMAAQEDERSRIALQLHDQMGQDVSALSFKLSMIKSKYGTHADLREQLDSLIVIAQQLSDAIDFLIWELRPTALSDLGLVVALSNYVKNWSKHFGIHAELHTTEMEKDRLTNEIETVLYRVTQEALTNVAKHAEASSVSILLERRSDQISLIIEDNGVGFDGAQAFGTQVEGVGLIGMRERLRLVRGALEIESQPGDGVTIVVRVPAPHFPSGEERNE